MDWIFWLPWALGVIIFLLWIKQPIVEFKRMIKNRHAQQDTDLEKDNS